VIKVAVIEDVRALRDGFSMLIDGTPGFQCCGKFRTVEEALERIKAGTKQGHCEEYYPTEERRILGAEDFVEKTKNRVGAIGKQGRLELLNRPAPDLEGLIQSVAKAFRLTPEDVCSRRKERTIVMAKEAMIIVGQELGVSNAALARFMGIDSSAVSRRFESGKTRMKDSREMQQLVKQIREAGGTDRARKV
jgi:hypothetical protein